MVIEIDGLINLIGINTQYLIYGFKYFPFLLTSNRQSIMNTHSFS